MAKKEKTEDQIHDEKLLRGIQQQTRREWNEFIKEYVDMYNELERDQFEQRLHYETVKQMESSMNFYKETFADMYIASQGYDRVYDEEKGYCQLVKRRRAKKDIL